ncbi:hypothetical protein HZH68_006522 [Vespula germanica]|uniref:Uncharacterized protein n=1 Tax=Vespula germanica TaxID=30212 RepID=A0A834NDS2_VESGE|nr:hypothetical protein HZH68_006522 [Vespula germanica]
MPLAYPEDASPMPSSCATSDLLEEPLPAIFISRIEISEPSMLILAVIQEIKKVGSSILEVSLETILRFSERSVCCPSKTLTHNYRKRLAKVGYPRVPCASRK